LLGRADVILKFLHSLVTTLDNEEVSKDSNLAFPKRKTSYPFQQPAKSSNLWDSFMLSSIDSLPVNSYPNSLAKQLNISWKQLQTLSGSSRKPN
jgi:hypothetical protein